SQYDCLKAEPTSKETELRHDHLTGGLRARGRRTEQYNLRVHRGWIRLGIITLEKILRNHTVAQWCFAGESCLRQRWTLRRTGVGGISWLSGSLGSLSFGSSR